MPFGDSDGDSTRRRGRRDDGRPRTHCRNERCAWNSGVTVKIEQPVLDFTHRAGNDLERRYRDWLATDAGRTVMPLVRRFAREMLQAHRRFGMKALAERVRWEVATTWRVEPGELKLNNSHVAYIARDLVRELPELRELMEFRRVRE